MNSPAGNAFIENACHTPQPAQLRWLNIAAESAVAAALIGELCLVIANAGARLFLDRSFLWVDEAARFALSILAFSGAIMPSSVSFSIALAMPGSASSLPWQTFSSCSQP